MKKLSVVKADKTELQSIQEALVKVEASFQKISRTVGENKDNYSKKQIEELLRNKVDRDELSDQLKELTRSMRKSRKAAVTTGGFMITEEDPDPAMSRTMSAIELKNAVAMKPAPVPKAGSRTGSGLADAKYAGLTHTFPDSRQLNVQHGNHLSNDNKMFSEGPEDPVSVNMTHVGSTEGWNLGPPSLHAIEPTLTSSGVPGGHGQDMSVLGAPTFGGGFNTKKKLGAPNHDHPGLKALGEVEPNTPDLEGGGM